MKPSPPEPPNSWASKVNASPEAVLSPNAPRSVFERPLQSVGPFAFANKTARLLIQLAHGLTQAFLRGAPDPFEAPALLHSRAHRLHKLSTALLEHFQVETRILGPAPHSGLLVSNHVSFVDIMLLSAARPMVFVSKSDVMHWPVVGPIASAAGTIFVERSRRTDVARVNAALRHALDGGLLVTLFPEGTSSDGSLVLPFQPSLLQPAVDLRLAITPAHLRYLNPDGTRADEVAYFGDRELGPCLADLIRRRSTVAEVQFGARLAPSGERKELARHLHSCVCALAPMHWR